MTESDEALVVHYMERIRAGEPFRSVSWWPSPMGATPLLPATAWLRLRPTNDWGITRLTPWPLT
jgi:hypothetical protein